MLGGDGNFDIEFMIFELELRKNTQDSEKYFSKIGINTPKNTPGNPVPEAKSLFSKYGCNRIRIFCDEQRTEEEGKELPILMGRLVSR